MSLCYGFHVPSEHFVGSVNFELELRAVGTLCAYAGFMHKAFPWNEKHGFNSLLPTRWPAGVQREFRCLNDIARGIGLQAFNPEGVILI